MSCPSCSSGRFRPNPRFQSLFLLQNPELLSDLSCSAVFAHAMPFVRNIRPPALSLALRGSLCCTPPPTPVQGHRPALLCTPRLLVFVTSTCACVAVPWSQVFSICMIGAYKQLLRICGMIEWMTEQVQLELVSKFFPYPKQWRQVLPLMPNLKFSSSSHTLIFYFNQTLCL